MIGKRLLDLMIKLRPPRMQLRSEAPLVQVLQETPGVIRTGGQMTGGVPLGHLPRMPTGMWKPLNYYQSMFRAGTSCLILAWTPTSAT